MIEIKSGIHRLVCGADYSRLHQGFAPGGPQDRFSCRLANQLLGNDSDAAAIEFTLAPAVFGVTQDCHLLIGGAQCDITIDGKQLPEWTVLAVNAGAEIRIRIGQAGCRVYLCVAGGLNADTSAAGDLMSGEVGRTRLTSDFAWEPKLGSVRVIAGPESTNCTLNSALDELTKQHWQVSPQSSAMGVRLLGPTLPLADFDIVSAPVQDGTIQATQSGLIGLLRERGTLGGYPRVATIIDCDVDRLAQFRPGSRLRFEIVDQDRAAELCRLQETSLQNECRG